jgi:hypothetical protein
MPQTDKSLVLPPAEEIKSMEDVREWIQKASGLLGFNQSDIYEDLDRSLDNYTDQAVGGTKAFTDLRLAGNMRCNQYQMLEMVIENRTDDPTSPVEGQMWLRTDEI